MIRNVFKQYLLFNNLQFYFSGGLQEQFLHTDVLWYITMCEVLLLLYAHIYIGSYLILKYVYVARPHSFSGKVPGLCSRSLSLNPGFGICCLWWFRWRLFALRATHSQLQIINLGDICFLWRTRVVLVQDFGKLVWLGAHCCGADIVQKTGQNSPPPQKIEICLWNLVENCYIIILMISIHFSQGICSH